MDQPGDRKRRPVGDEVAVSAGEREIVVRSLADGGGIAGAVPGKEGLSILAQPHPKQILRAGRGIDVEAEEQVGHENAAGPAG